jgi:sugar lactone lactonase YvrE
MTKSICSAFIAITALTGISGCSDDDDDSAEEKYTTHILVHGTTINSASSVHFSPAGEMLVVDTGAKKILTMDPDTGQILDTFTEGVDGPADIDFGPDGTMFWMNSFMKEAYKRTPDGQVSRIAQLESVVDGVAVNAEGRVFTSSLEVGKNELWELDPYGVQPPRLVAELGGLDAYDFGPDGYLYAPDFLNGTGQVFKIDINSGAYEVIADGLCQPIATKFNAAGELYVLDYLCPKVVKVDITTGEKTLVTNVSPGPDNFDFSPAGELFIAILGDTYIGKILPDGTVQNITTPGMASPGSIALRSDGSLFVATPFGLRLYDVETAEFQKAFYTDTGMIPPYSFYDDGKNFILTCHLFHGVQVWDPEENKAVETHTVELPLNAIRFRGDVIVADMDTGSVFKLDDQRTPLIEEISVPAGLAAKGDDLYVGDMATGIIWKAVESGVRLNPPLMVAEGLAAPEGITFDNEGRLLVMETGAKRLIRIDPESGSRFIAAENLEVGLEAVGGTPPTWSSMSSVAVAESGTLYATGDVGNVIYRIEKDEDN